MSNVLYNVNLEKVTNEGEYGTVKEIIQFLKESGITLPRSVTSIHGWGLNPLLKENKNGDVCQKPYYYSKAEALKVALEKDKTQSQRCTSSRAVVSNKGKMFDRLTDNVGVVRAVEMSLKPQMKLQVKLKKIMEEIEEELA
jgi:hypothetical protein